MKRVTFTICCVLLLSSQAVGFAPIGPASSDLDQGQFATGAEYVKGDFKTIYENYTVTWSNAGFNETSYLPGKTDAELYLDGFFGKVSFGLTDRCTVSAGLNQDGWGLGTKLTLKESKALDWGMAVWVDFLSCEDKLSDSDWEYLKGQVDLYTARIAIGPVYKIDGLRLYGGPFVFWANGDGDLRGKYVSGEISLDVRSRWDVKTELELGGYIGMSIELLENLDVQVEYQLARDLSIFGAGLSFKF